MTLTADMVFGPLNNALLLACVAMVNHSATAADFASFSEFQAVVNATSDEAFIDPQFVASAQENMPAVYELLKQPSLSYDVVLECYRSILLNNPGKALCSGGDTYAVLVDHLSGEEYMYGVHAEQDGTLTHDEVEGGFDFDESAFADCSWDGETQEQTLLAILKPVLIDLPA